MSRRIPSEVLGRRRRVRRDEERTHAVLIAFRASPVSLQCLKIGANFREEETVALNPASPAFAVLVSEMLLQDILLAANVDSR